MLALLILQLAACGWGKSEKTRIEVELAAPVGSIAFGTSTLELGSTLLINGKFAWRDGLLYVPLSYSPQNKAPLLVWLHGGGGHAHQAERLFPIAEKLGIVILALDSRHNTWDGIDSPFGPDVRFIQRAMQYTVERLAIDPGRIALGGLSDGASYALALGRSNGDLFSHLIGVAPWRMKPPAPVEGRPRIFLAHGNRDNIYPQWHTSRFIVPSLQKDGYDVTYFEFDGPHSVAESAGLEMLRWLKGRVPSPSAVDLR